MSFPQSPHSPRAKPSCCWPTRSQLVGVALSNRSNARARAHTPEPCPKILSLSFYTLNAQRDGPGRAIDTGVNMKHVHLDNDITLRTNEAGEYIVGSIELDGFSRIISGAGYNPRHMLDELVSALEHARDVAAVTDGYDSPLHQAITKAWGEVAEHRRSVTAKRTA